MIRELEKKQKKTTSAPFLHRLLAFVQFLRGRGFEVTPAETLDMVQAVAQSDIAQIGEFRDALRATLVKHAEDYPRFEVLFTQFWLAAGQTMTSGRIALPNNALLGKANSDLFPAHRDDGVPAKRDAAIYSPFETRGKKNFGELDAIADRLLLKRRLKTFARATATLPGRRYSSKGSELDFRKTLRASMKTGGHGLQLEFRSKKITKSRIVVLVDISGSMDFYSEKILKVIFHMKNTVRSSVIFGFSTKLVPLNPFLQGKSLGEASRLITKNVDSWSSGTRIGSALAELMKKYPSLLQPSTVFVMISDGWELGDLDTFGASLRKISRRVDKIVWLNPQADSPDFQPLAEGMKIAMPIADVLSGLDIFSNRKKFKVLSVKVRKGKARRRRVLANYA